MVMINFPLNEYEKPLYENGCMNCSSTFLSGNPNQSFCSQACYVNYGTNALSTSRVRQPYNLNSLLNTVNNEYN